jgi:hypothetical protein
MLRLKQAMDELKIPQQAFVAASGWSKTQVSLTLNSGKLPANSAKFASDVQDFAENHPELVKWLGERGLAVPALMDDLSLPENAAEPSPDLERVLCEIAGRAVLAAEGCNNLVLSLVRVSSHLHRTLTGLVGEDSPWVARTETEIFEILKGVRP